MISLIKPTYHPARVERTNALYDMLKKESGIEVEVIVVCDNPEIVNQLKYDVLVPLPKRIGFTRAINIGEKFASNELAWWIDDYVIPEPDWGPKAVEGFYTQFPDGMGIMELSGYQTDCPKSLSTRSFMYGLNGNNWLWNEYLHCGDTETWYKANDLGKFYVYPEILWHRDKIFDACKTQSDKEYGFDIPLRTEREQKGWPLTSTPKLQKRMEEWAYGTNEVKNIELYKNIWNR